MEKENIAQTNILNGQNSAHAAILHRILNYGDLQLLECAAQVNHHWYQLATSLQNYKGAISPFLKKILKQKTPKEIERTYNEVSLYINKLEAFISEFVKKFKRVQNLLKNNNALTRWKLWHSIQPLVCLLYKSVQGTPKERKGFSCLELYGKIDSRYEKKQSVPHLEEELKDRQPSLIESLKSRIEKVSPRPKKGNGVTITNKDIKKKVIKKKDTI